MAFAVLFPRTNDRWMMRQQNQLLADAIEALPADAIPPSMTSVDVAHALSTMSDTDVEAVLEKPGLEAALQEVFGGRGGGDGVVIRPETTGRTKKVVL